jgi:hypothetical protein
MAKRNVYVLTIHDSAEGVLRVDLKDVLHALRSHVPQWTWCVRGLDAVGEDLGEFCDLTEKAPVWLSAEELLALAQRIEQTIEGEFLAFPRELSEIDLDESELELGRFPESRAELAITAVDSSCFDVYAKDLDCVNAIRQSFKDIRTQDPQLVFES